MPTATAAQVLIHFAGLVVFTQTQATNPRTAEVRPAQSGRLAVTQPHLVAILPDVTARHLPEITTKEKTANLSRQRSVWSHAVETHTAFIAFQSEDVDSMTPGWRAKATPLRPN